MNSSQFMDKQITGLAGGGERADGDLFDLKKEEIVPSYDFQPIRTVGSSSSVVSNSNDMNLDAAAKRSWGSADSKIGSASLKYSNILQPHEPSKVSQEYDVATVTEIDRTVKKYADNLLHTLEGVSSRLVQLESRTRHLENSVDELKDTIGHNSGSTDGKLRHLENILREVQIGVQVLRDKQEIAETQLQLAKLQQTSSKAEHHRAPLESSNATAPQPESLSLMQRPPPPPPQTSYQPTPPAPQAPPPQPPPPTLPTQNVPPPPQFSQPQLASVPSLETSYFPQAGAPPVQLQPQSQPPPPQPQHYQLPQYPQTSYQPPPPAPQAPPQQPPPPTLPTQNVPPPPQFSQPQLASVPSLETSYFPQAGTPPVQPQPQSQPPPPQPQRYQLPQYPQPLHLEEPVPYMPPPQSQAYPPSIRQSGPLSQPPPSSVPSQYYGSGQLPPFASNYGPTDGGYPYGGGSPSHYSSSTMKQPSPFTSSPPSSSNGGSSNYSRLPTAKILPQVVPAGQSSGGGGRVPIDDVVDKVATMGFSREQVRATVRKLTENGQSVDLNVVLDKLMNGGGGEMIQPQKGWFGR